MTYPEKRERAKFIIFTCLTILVLIAAGATLIAAFIQYILQG